MNNPFYNWVGAFACIGFVLAMAWVVASMIAPYVRKEGRWTLPNKFRRW